MRRLVFSLMVVVVLGGGVVPAAAHVTTLDIHREAFLTDAGDVNVFGHLVCTAGEGVAIRVTVQQPSGRGTSGPLPVGECSGEVLIFGSGFFPSEGSFRLGKAEVTVVAATKPDGARTVRREVIRVVPSE
jgi:hypothetical protein